MFDKIILTIGTIATVTGVWMIMYQIKSARVDAMTSSLLSAIAEHWFLIEERRIQLRGADTKIVFPGLFSQLDELLKSKYADDLSAFAKGYLRQHAEYTDKSREEVFQAIAREYAFQDMVFNFYEEEFLAGKQLKLADRRLWEYWEFYIKDAFRSPVKQNHWQLRRKLGRTFPQFVEYIEQNCLSP